MLTVRIGLLAAGLVIAGCAPQTQYRRTAYVPAVRPIPFDGRTAPAGTLRAECTLTESDLSPHLFPQPGDTAVLVPRWSIEGSAMVAITSHVDLCVRALYAACVCRQASSVGTMPLP